MRFAWEKTSGGACGLTRRVFLQRAGLIGAAVLSGTSRAQQGQQGQWRLRLSTSSIHFKELPIEQACARVARLGFEAIDIWSAHEGCPHLDDVAARLGAEGLKKLLNKYKLRLCAFSVYRGGFLRYAELLGRFGGGVAVQGSGPACKTSELKGCVGRFIERLKPAIEAAEKYNCYLAIENHGNSLLDSLDSLKAFVEASSEYRRVGVALAPYHLQARGASVEQAIRICGQKLFFFYAWQRYPGIQQLPGIGPTDMTGWVRALQQIRYRGYVNAFMHGRLEPDVMEAKLAKARDYLRDCFARINRVG